MKSFNMFTRRLDPCSLGGLAVDEMKEFSSGLQYLVRILKKDVVFGRLDIDIVYPWLADDVEKYDRVGWFVDAFP